MSEAKINPIKSYEGIEKYFDVVRISTNKVFHSAKKSGAKAVQPGLKEELYQTGMVALIEAWNNFDPSKDTSFKTYSYYRVKGSLLDFLRAEDTCSRSTRASLKLIKHDSDTNTFSSDTLTRDQINTAIKRSTIVHQFGSIPNTDKQHNQIDGQLDVEDTSNKYLYIEAKETVKKLLEKCPLTEREQIIVNQHYFEEKTLLEIGKHLDITESRVSQLHKEALEKLRNHAK